MAVLVMAAVGHAQVWDDGFEFNSADDWCANCDGGLTKDVMYTESDIAYTYSTDFDGLTGLVEQELGQQVESGHLFLFFNRRRDRVKVLWFVGDGSVI